MNQCNRIKTILQENNINQTQFAAELGVTKSYISKLLKEPDINLSNTLANLIEERYGYSALWILHGTEPKYVDFSKNMNLSILHRKAIRKIKTMDDSQLKALLSFIELLDSTSNT